MDANESIELKTFKSATASDVTRMMKAVRKMKVLEILKIKVLKVMFRSFTCINNTSNYMQKDLICKG